MGATGLEVKGVGPAPCEVMIVGEGPGPEESQRGVPFIGRAGKELDRLIWDHLILNRSEVFITNVCRYYPGKDAKGTIQDPTPEDLKRDRPAFIKEMRQVRPQFVITLGRVATRWFLGDVSMEQVHGVPHTLPPGHMFEGVVVIPAYHPAAGLYAGDMMSFVAYDFQQAHLAIKRKISLDPPTDEYAGNEYYKEITDSPADLDELDHWMDLDPEIANDTEGVPGNEWCLSFSTHPGTGFVIHKSSRLAIDRFQRRARRRRDSDLLIFHNSMYDIEMNRGLGVEVADVPFVDTMVLAYHLQLEPQGLKPLAFRWCGMEMGEYNELLRPLNEQYAIEYLDHILSTDKTYWGKLPQVLVWEAGEPKVKSPQTPYQFALRCGVDIAKHLDGKGKAVDIRARWMAQHPLTRAAAEAHFGPMREATLDDVPREAAVYYAARDADATKRLKPRLYYRVKYTGRLLQSALNDMRVIPMLERMQYMGMPIDRPALRQYAQELTDRDEALHGEFYRMTGCRINPNSPDEVAALVYGITKDRTPTTKDQATKDQKLVDLAAHSSNITVDKRTKGGKASTNKKAVESLRTENTLIDNVSTRREVQKARDSFALPLSERTPVIRRAVILGNEVVWEACQGTIRVTRVVSGRISMADPNLTAIPVRNDIGLGIRRGFKAPPGLELAGWDLDQVEMRVMADKSEDPNLIHLFKSNQTNPKVDVHSYTAGRMFKFIDKSAMEMTDDDWDLLKKMVDKNLHRTPAKRVGFGVITGITGHGLLDQMRMAGISGWDVDTCDTLINDYLKRIFTHVETYMFKARRRARNNGFVESTLGRRRYLGGAQSYVERVRIDAERQSHSHEISSTAQDILKSGMIRFWEQYMPEIRQMGVYCEPIIQIHDEVIFLCEKGFAESYMDERVVECLTQTMTLPSGVPLGAKGGWGQDWGELK